MKDSKRLVLYSRLGEEAVVCSFGEKHERFVYTRKFVYWASTWQMDNGYYKKVMPVFEDAQGRRYYQHETIDYANNSFFVREGTPLSKHFSAREPRGLYRILGEVEKTSAEITEAPVTLVGSGAAVAQTDSLFKPDGTPWIVGPHCRACGIRKHPHGTACHPNCPTCAGRGPQDGTR